MDNILLRLLPAVYGDLGLTNLFVTNISLISCNLSLLQLFSLCMDNAGNNDVLARYLPVLIPSFRGMAARGRCFPHIINLLAKVCITELLLYSGLNKHSDIYILLFSAA
jgi:hypothetical protein